MEKIKLKMDIVIGLMAGVILTAGFSLLIRDNASFVKVVLAQDESSERSENREGSQQTVIEYKTIYTKLPDRIVTTTKQIPRYDSDKDGLYDDEDPHPTINEFLIVEDKNLNGIDDRYDQ